MANNHRIGSDASHSTFLRGGQIWFHNARMYAQLLSRLFVICVLATFGTAILFATTFHGGIESRMAGYKLSAQVNLWTNRPDRPMHILFDDEHQETLTATEVMDDARIDNHASVFIERVVLYMWMAGIVGVGIFCFLFYWFTVHGKRLGTDRHLRGAKLVAGKELALMIDATNAQKRKEFKTKAYKPYSLAGIPYPFRSETQHTLIMGTTGAGKTQLMAPLLEEIRARGDRAIIYDKMRSFVPTFYDPDAGDVILNPLDERCPDWSPFQDAKTLIDYTQMAEALMPTPKGASDPFWIESARLVFAVTAFQLTKMGKRTNKDLIHMLLKSDMSELADFLNGSLASAAVSAENPKTTMSIRATMTSQLWPFEPLIRPGAHRKPFSIREWVSNDEGSGFLFLTSRSDQHAIMRPMISVWMDLAINAIMAQTRNSDRTVWVFLDELPSLNVLPSLEKGLAEGRQFGAAFVLGIQTLSQLESIYGKEIAKTVTGLARTKVILNLADPDTAKEAASYIGRSEIQRAQRGLGFGAATVRDGVNYTIQDKMEDLVMPEDLMRLENLKGYYIPAGAFPAAQVAFPYRPLVENSPGYVGIVDDADDLDVSTIQPAIPLPPAPPEPGPKPAHEEKRGGRRNLPDYVMGAGDFSSFSGARTGHMATQAPGTTTLGRSGGGDGWSETGVYMAAPAAVISAKNGLQDSFEGSGDEAGPDSLQSPVQEQSENDREDEGEALSQDVNGAEMDAEIEAEQDDNSTMFAEHEEGFAHEEDYDR